MSKTCVTFLAVMLQTILLTIFMASKGEFLFVNLALNKRAYLSSTFFNYGAGYAVDGNTNGNSFAHANNNADWPIKEEAWFVIDLGRPYQVEYIVFYPRSGCCYDRMDNFIVGLSSKFDPKINKTIPRYSYQLCNQYNGSITSDTKKVELPCRDKEFYSRYVIVQQALGQFTLTIAEIEVYGEYINYVGCYQTMNNITLIGPNYTLKRCINECDDLHFIYAAVQTSSCYCGNGTKNVFPLSECNVKCPGNVDACGGSNKLSVYKAFGQKYIGCFIDYQTRDLTHNMPDKNYMTIDKCRNYCFGLHFAYYALQYGAECFCDNKCGIYGQVPDTECNMSCSGNNSQKCGSAYRNSIYIVVSDQMTNSPHCGNGVTMNSDGLCDPCKSGWSGDDCTKRNCLSNNGACGIHACNVVDMAGESYSECICKDGYDKSFWWDSCHDINECMDNSHKCNTSTSNCNNTEGSYYCPCFSNLYSYDNYTCIDIDECKTSQHQCNTSTTTCLNTFRSYSCECIDGFKRENEYFCEDVNECSNTSSACDLTISNCTNTFGSYLCGCFQGYENVDDKHCSAIATTGLIFSLFSLFNFFANIFSRTFDV